MADDLASLIQSGRLPKGTTLFHKGRRGNLDVTATVTEEGILTRGRVYSSPSGAAKAYTGK